MVSTDPPYYDNIGYADLSDYFYVWLRLSMRSVFPDLFATITVPKGEELVATPYRHGNKERAETFFLDGMSPDTDHWLYTLAEEVQPEGYEFFAQPAGDGPEAENRNHLPADY